MEFLLAAGISDPFATIGRTRALVGTAVVGGLLPLAFSFLPFKDGAKWASGVFLAAGGLYAAVIALTKFDGDERTFLLGCVAFLSSFVKSTSDLIIELRHDDDTKAKYTKALWVAIAVAALIVGFLLGEWDVG